MAGRLFNRSRVSEILVASRVGFSVIRAYDVAKDGESPSMYEVLQILRTRREQIREHALLAWKRLKSGSIKGSRPTRDRSGLLSRLNEPHRFEFLVMNVNTYSQGRITMDSTSYDADSGKSGTEMLLDTNPNHVTISRLREAHYQATLASLK